MLVKYYTLEIKAIDDRVALLFGHVLYCIHR